METSRGFRRAQGDATIALPSDTLAKHTASLSRSMRRHVAYVDEGGMVHKEGAAPAGDALNLAWIRYARNLLDSPAKAMNCIWIGGSRQWLRLDLTVRTTLAIGPCVEIESEEIAPLADLSSRELDVLTLVAAGLANANIGARLGISSRTVAKHIQNIFRKCDVWTRASLAGLALQNGMVRLPTPGGADGLNLTTAMVERWARAGDVGHARSLRPTIPRPILIGMPLVYEGRGMADASEMLNGAVLGVESVNRRGGINGRRIELVTVPVDTSSPTSLLSAYTDLVHAEVDAITAGYSCAEASLHRLLSDYRCPYLHAATMNSTVECVRNDTARLGNIFQVCASDIKYGPGLVRFLDHLEASGSWTPDNRRIVVIEPMWPGLDLGLTRIGGRRFGRDWQIETVPDGNLDPVTGWAGTMDRLERLDPSVVVLASYFAEDAIAFQRAFRSRSLRSLVYKLYSPSIPQYREELGELCDGVLWATTTGLYSDQIGLAFASVYKTRFGLNPGHSHAGIAFDRIHILANAWSRVGSSRLFAHVAEDLRSQIHRGVNGSYFLGSSGQAGLAYPDDTTDPSISQAHLVFQIKNGAQTIVDPSPYADSSFTVPPWMG